jgi:hypothetical protein
MGRALSAECPSRHLDDLHAGAIVAFQELEELPGDGSLDAPPDLSAALALGSPASGIGAGLRVITQPHQRDRVQRPVEPPVATAVQPVAGTQLVRSRDRSWTEPLEVSSLRRVGQQTWFSVKGRLTVLATYQRRGAPIASRASRAPQHPRGGGRLMLRSASDLIFWLNAILTILGIAERALRIAREARALRRDPQRPEPPRS